MLEAARQLKHERWLAELLEVHSSGNKPFGFRNGIEVFQF